MHLDIYRKTTRCLIQIRVHRHGKRYVKNVTNCGHSEFLMFSIIYIFEFFDLGPNGAIIPHQMIVRRWTAKNGSAVVENP